MSLWWLLSCEPTAERRPVGVPTERGLYQIAAEHQGEDLRITILDCRDEPVVDAALEVELPGVLVDPGECDSEGPVRCDHPGGRYVLRKSGGVWPRELWLGIEADAGADRGLVRSPGP